jgi:hypothetical protein
MDNHDIIRADTIRGHALNLGVDSDYDTPYGRLNVGGDAIIKGTMKVDSLRVTTNMDLEGYLFRHIANSDGEFSGTIVSRQAGENLSVYDLVYVDNGGKLKKANGSTVTTMPVVYMTMQALSTDDWGYFLEEGYVQENSWTWTTGGMNGILYVDTSAGTITQTAPSGSGNMVQVVGTAITSTKIKFNPQLYVLELN